MRYCDRLCIGCAPCAALTASRSDESFVFTLFHSIPKTSIDFAQRPASMFKAVRLNATTYPVGVEEHTELARAHAQLVEIEGQQSDEIIAAAADCDALLVVSSKVPASVIEHLAKCRVIA